EQNGFYVRDTNDTINRLEQLNRSNLIQAGFVTAFLVLIFTGLMLVLTAVQTLRTDAKMAQIGLLKAIGMSESFLRWMFIAESLIIWFLGTIVAVITSFLLGKYVVAPALIPEASRYASLAFQFRPAMVSTIACSVAACWIVMTVLTTRKAIGTSPARLLQTL
ncbi:MAG: ABC transporter permease, partial [Thermogutta sp.]|uniref:FtsX-like permease family protein n=1 Tax=Thermogutta sp. TaxID=1962930 RepID=UPI0019CE1614